MSDDGESSDSAKRPINARRAFVSSCSDTGSLAMRCSSTSSSCIAPSVTAVRTSVVASTTPGNVVPVNEL